MLWEPCGPAAVVFYFGDASDPDLGRRGLAITRHLQARPPQGLREFIPGPASVLVEFEGVRERGLAGRASALALQLGALPPVAEETLPPPVEISVCYDGPDLVFVAEAAGLTVAELITRHSAPVYDVQAVGFTPGFAYLGPLEAALQVPRRPTPRLRVPAGSVALAGPHTGVYTVESAAGWHLLGRTEARFFDPSRWRAPEGPCLLQPGGRVKFIPLNHAC